MEKRKYFCEEELRLNKRLTNGMYLKVVPVRTFNDQFFIGKEIGKIADYAVKMKRIEGSKQMHLLLEKNKITKEDIERIAKILVPFHQTASIITTPLDISELKENFNDIQSIKDFAKKTLGTKFEKIIQASIQFSDFFIDKNAAHFAERIRKGMIRDGHGDLHSSNIFIDEHPIIFDCIEFNPKFRTIDILDELAFFCIDLDAYNHEELSDLFIKKYHQLFPKILQSEMDRQLFLYYKLYRANVRAKVNALKAKEMTSGKKKEAIISESKKYLELMKKYLSELK